MELNLTIVDLGVIDLIVEHHILNHISGLIKMMLEEELLVQDFSLMIGLSLIYSTKEELITLIYIHSYIFKFIIMEVEELLLELLYMVQFGMIMLNLEKGK
jgi:hypothetical protein